MPEILPTAVLGCLALTGLAGTWYALARLRRYARTAERREARELAELTSAQTTDTLLRLLADVRTELRRANSARDARCADRLSRRPEQPP